MSTVPWLNNVLAYSLQIALLVGIGALIPWIFRLRHPRVLLAYWQCLLLLVLLLPLLQPLQKLEIVVPAAVESGPLSSGVTVRVEESEDQSSTLFPPLNIFLGSVLIAGVLIRVCWLAVGFFRLRALRAHSHPLVPLPEPVRLIREMLQIYPRFRISSQIPGPVTFGILEPIVLFPAGFANLDDASQRALACHEMLHIRRRDWLYTVLEEFIRTVFWFHPAIWWLIEQVQAAREQVVDREVLEWTASRPAYLEALLQVAESRVRSAGIPAPLFLRERQLARRVALMLEEVSMSKRRVILSMICMGMIVAAGGFLAVRAFPLTGALVVLESAPATQTQSGGGQESTPPGDYRLFEFPGAGDPQNWIRTGAPEPQREPIRVGGNVQASKLIDRVEPIYPQEAKDARVQGVVLLQVSVNEAGEVWAINVIRGHPLLVPAAVDAVKQWRYSETTLEGEPMPVAATVAVNFVLKGAPGTEGPPLVLHMDQSGIIWAGTQRLEGADLMDHVQRANRWIELRVHPLIPQALISETVQFLHRVSDQQVQVQRGF